MTLQVPNLDRIQKASAPLGEAVQRQETFANQVAAAKGAYVAASTYSQGDTVLYLGVYYRSLINVNVGNTPAVSPSFWQALGTAQVSPPSGFVHPGTP